MSKDYIPVNHPEKECLWCKRLFKPNRKDKQFCCQTHYKKYGQKYYGHSKGKKRSRPWKKGTLTGYRKYKKSCCEVCGFTSSFPCQFDIDHIDGNHSNNQLANLQTLCANCHRLKTYNQRWN